MYKLRPEGEENSLVLMSVCPRLMLATATETTL